MAPPRSMASDFDRTPSWCAAIGPRFLGPNSQLVVDEEARLRFRALPGGPRASSRAPPG